MSASRYRPRRRLRSELPPLAMMLALPLALCLALPSGVVDFVPKSATGERGCANAMIVLDADREAKLLAAARTAWQSDAASRSGVSADLLACDFSRVNIRIANGLEPAAPERLANVLEYEFDPMPAGVAADAPAVFAPEPPKPTEPTFPKTELLKLKE